MGVVQTCITSLLYEPFINSSLIEHKVIFSTNHPIPFEIGWLAENMYDNLKKSLYLAWYTIFNMTMLHSLYMHLPTCLAYEIINLYFGKMKQQLFDWPHWVNHIHMAKLKSRRC